MVCKKTNTRQVAILHLCFLSARSFDAELIEFFRKHQIRGDSRTAQLNALDASKTSANISRTCSAATKSNGGLL